MRVRYVLDLVSVDKPSFFFILVLISFCLLEKAALTGMMLGKLTLVMESVVSREIVDVGFCRFQPETNRRKWDLTVCTVAIPLGSRTPGVEVPMNSAKSLRVCRQ